MVVRSGWVMPVSAGVWVPAAVVIGGFVSIPGLGALLDRVSPICGGRSLSWLDQRDLVDLDFGIWRVLDVDVHQGWVERHLLIGQWQSVHGVEGRFGVLVAGILVVRGGSGSSRRGWQVTELSC